MGKFANKHKWEEIQFYRDFKKFPKLLSTWTLIRDHSLPCVDKRGLFTDLPPPVHVVIECLSTFWGYVFLLFWTPDYKRSPYFSAMFFPFLSIPLCSALWWIWRRGNHFNGALESQKGKKFAPLISLSCNSQTLLTLPNAYKFKFFSHYTFSMFAVGPYNKLF